MDRPGQVLVWSAALTALLVVTTIVSAALGPVRIDPLTVAAAVLNEVVVPSAIVLESRPVWLLDVSVPWPGFEYRSVFAFDVQGSHQAIVGTIRLPRIALGATVGFALAAAGTVMQGFFRNPLADPSIIGVSTGAAAGAVAALAFPTLVPIGLRPAAFISAIGTALLVYAVATEGGRTPVATLLLAGVAIQAFLGAMISYMLVHSGESLREAIVWLMGHLNNSSWGDVWMSLPVAVLGVLVLAAYTREMNVLLLGEEDAHHLGVDVERTKLLLLVIASVITAAGVAVAGVIGFVGLVVPHIMRLIVGPDHRILLPTSALAGASFLVITDTIARVGPAEVPVGIVTAALGAPFFLYLLMRQEVHSL
ncbi:vitamin B12 ABC transporter permease BtuC [Halobacteria archaeon AArc-curdl1]|uniref:Vitamin B12 ABC transporter permease BtuC n=1 Tax=Natronosalvus hydrolyticus TaxID=2979988 RepID=A0AAP2Z9V1_9EURY|nr:vitamin B12 ABC transporter permease BtuC [Halobacteria archaeon AArc-curdl1]